VTISSNVIEREADVDVRLSTLETSLGRKNPLRE
jgi:hypothetical protein